MRELAYGGRGTGRTTTLLMTMIEEMSMHEDRVYLIVSTYNLGMFLKDSIRRLNGEPSRVQIVSLSSLYTVRGTDFRNVYIEHTAYEQATSKQLSELYLIEDRKDYAIYGRNDT
jgi:hypothetical protein